MRNGRASKRALVTAAAAAIAAATMAPTASAAEAAPPCEVMLPPDVCEQYYYGTLTLVGGVTGTVVQTADGAKDAAFDVAIWASDTLSCAVWKNCS